MESRERGREREKVDEEMDEGGRKEGRATLKGMLSRKREGKGKESGCVVYGRSNASRLGGVMYSSAQDKRTAAAICSFHPFSNCPSVPGKLS